MTKRIATSRLCTAAVAVLLLSGCETIKDMDTRDSFEDRLEALDAVYKQGQTARKSMEKLGVIIDETSCGSSWVTSGAQDAENDMQRDDEAAFQDLRRLSFINGCMNRPNDLPATSAPTLPGVTPPSSVTPTPSATPS